ncbi:DNA polymerase I [Geomicrobium sp. JCM 19037]|uniref:DNA polymerase n=1 Tax=Geomicrobium sp. JCM 19037 TaxID=1460634 RepID=UPI00045F3106|nr:DNA polymerase [Geomicrobium sp. JCM 19037]GAK03299.1 DNA polymerase I [Geomicrobium sp. JCM 19037]
MVELKTQAKAAPSKAVSKRKDASLAATETIDEAWTRIYATKLSALDRRKLDEVKAAMGAGQIDRDPADRYNKRGQPKKFSKAEALRLYPALLDRKRADKLRNMVDEMPSNYWIIRTERHLEWLCALLDAEDEIVFDVETTGVDIWGGDYIVGHVISAVDADVHAYIPTKHRTDDAQLPHRLVTNTLKPYYEDAALKKIAHNGKFDIHMLANDGINLRGFAWDTQEAMRLLNENETSFALKKLAVKYLGTDSWTYGELFGKAGFDSVEDLGVATAYAAMDGDITLKLRDFQRKHLAQMSGVLEYYETVEAPLTDVIVHMERTGFDIDLDFAASYGAELQTEIDGLATTLAQKLDGINLNSPAQLKPALEKATGKKLESTDAKKVLKPLAQKHSVIEQLLRYKELTKLHSTYINALPQLVDAKTGKLHTSFNQNGAATGRFSSGGSGVNLQNQHQKARKLFVAPPGYALLSGDWSQQEVRCTAHMTGEPTLVEAYNKGLDVYASMAADVYEKPIEECGDGTFERKSMKTGVLASLYGTGPKTLAQQLGISEQEARVFLDDFFEKMPYVKRWIDETKAFATKHGYVWMDRQQRKRRYPTLKISGSLFRTANITIRHTKNNVCITRPLAVRCDKGRTQLYKERAQYRQNVR